MKNQDSEDVPWMLNIWMKGCSQSWGISKRQPAKRKRSRKLLTDEPERLAVTGPEKDRKQQGCQGIAGQCKTVEF